jgi:hypothetical protein
MKVGWPKRHILPEKAAAQAVAEVSANGNASGQRNVWSNEHEKMGETM